MRFILLFTISFLYTSLCFAQIMSFSPDDDFYGTATSENYNIFQIDIFNETTDSLRLAWKFIDDTTPEDWEITLCDNRSCFGLIPANGIMRPILDDKGLIKLTVNPGLIDGEGTLTFLIFNTEDQTVSHEIRFHITTVPVATENIPQVEVQVFPNPASDFVMIENLESEAVQISMANTNGKPYHHSILKVGAKKKIETTHYPNGFYLLNLNSNQKNSTTKKIFIAH